MHLPSSFCIQVVLPFFCLMSDKKFSFKSNNGENQKSEILPPDTSLHDLSSSYDTNLQTFLWEGAHR